MQIEYFTSFLNQLGHDLADWRLIETAYLKEWHCHCRKDSCGKMFVFYRKPQEWCLDRIRVNQYGVDFKEEVIKLNDRNLRVWDGTMNIYREKATIYKHLLCSKLRSFQ